MFPYPSGAGLHVGHPLSYTATDIVARYKRHRGLQRAPPDGLGRLRPAGRAVRRARRGSTRAITTRRTSTTSAASSRRWALSYDWSPRDRHTTDPDYYRWTQWIFLKLYEKGLAYQAEVPVNWCPALGTVLANEEVIDGARASAAGTPSCAGR